MKRHLRFAAGALGALLAACCLIGAAATAWLRAAAGAMAELAALGAAGSAAVLPLADDADAGEPAAPAEAAEGRANACGFGAGVMAVPPARSGTLPHPAAGGRQLPARPPAPPGSRAAAL